MLQTPGARFEYYNERRASRGVGRCGRQNGDQEIKSAKIEMRSLLEKMSYLSHIYGTWWLGTKSKLRID